MDGAQSSKLSLEGPHRRNDSSASTITGKRKLDDISRTRPSKEVRSPGMSHPEERPSNEAQLPPYQQDWTTYSEREQTPASEPQMIIPSTPPPVEMSYTSPPPSDKPEPSGKDIGDTKAQSYDPMLPLEEFDLADLEQRFIDSMEVMGKKTEAIQKEWVELIELFSIYASTVPNYDPQRCHKRVRTRLRRLEIEEDRLEKSRQNYIRVVKAFQTAFSMIPA